jgi:hypothetical protein
MKFPFLSLWISEKNVVTPTTPTATSQDWAFLELSSKAPLPVFTL